MCSTSRERHGSTRRQPISPTCAGSRGSLRPISRSRATSAQESGRTRTSVTVRNVSPAGTPALGIHVSLLSHAGAPVAPVIWNENDLVLFEGQSATMTAECGAASVADMPPWVEVDAFNLPGPLSVVID